MLQKYMSPWFTNPSFIPLLFRICMSSVDYTYISLTVYIFIVFSIGPKFSLILFNCDYLFNVDHKISFIKIRYKILHFYEC